MRDYTSTWHTQAREVSFRWPQIQAKLAEVPATVWALIVVGVAIATASAVGGVPQASNPAAERLGAELALSAAENRDLRSEIELKTLEVERLGQIQGFSGEFRIPADRAMLIYDIALAEDVNPELAFNLVRVESGFRRTAVSSAGAIGFTQVRPSTARWLDPTVETQDLFDPVINLHLGFRYFRYLLDEYNGDTRLALLAYNRGPGRVGGLLRSGIDPANGYAKAVLGE
ncbi:MAG: lytic transglycosylase domain-containing protein [Gemmatimonadales bacterium]|jgi:soluble lytic murein transglycosylase-like protein